MYASAKKYRPLQLQLCLLFIIITGCLALSGCMQNQPPETGPEINEQNQSMPENNLENYTYLWNLPVLEPSILKILKSNPINMEAVSEYTPYNLSKEVILISGLLDPDIENSINNALIDTYNNIEDGTIPPYRGIYQVIPKDTPVAQIDIYAYPSFNFEHILSIPVNGNLVYDLAAEENQNSSLNSSLQEPVSAGVIECLNYDLRNGQEILLPELFADPSSAMDYINDAVANILARENHDPEGIFYSAPTLASAFSGLEANQKYYLTESGISLVIDYLNPEFDVLYYPAQIYLPFSLFDGKLAIDKRFAADTKEVYSEPEKIEYQFVYRDTQPGNEQASFSIYDQKENLDIYVNMLYPDLLPAGIMNRVTEAKADVNYTIANLESLPPRTDALEGEIMYFEYTLIVNCKGPYFTLRESIFTHGLEDNIFQIDYQTYTPEGFPVKLEDCFGENYDYRNAIYSAYLEQQGDYGFGQAVTLEQLFEKMSFNLETTGLEFVLSGQEIYLVYFIPYNEFGYENLTIFQ